MIVPSVMVEPLADDEILGVDARPDVDGVLDAAIDRAVLQAVDALDRGGGAHPDILEQPGVDDPGPFAHGAHPGPDRRRVAVDQRPQVLDHLGPVLVERQDVGGLGRQMVVDRDLPAPGLVDHRDLRPVAERAFALDGQQVDVVDDRVVFDDVIGHVIPDGADVDVVADGAIVDRGVADAGRLGHAAEEGDLLVEHAEPHVAGEMRRAHARPVRKSSATCTLDQSVQVHPCCESRPISSADSARHLVVMIVLYPPSVLRASVYQTDASIAGFQGPVKPPPRSLWTQKTANQRSSGVGALARPL